MPAFSQTTAKLAVWNIAGYNRISQRRLRHQVEALAVIDAEVVILVECKPFDRIQAYAKGLANKGVTYHWSIKQQQSNLNIGILYKDGVIVSPPKFIPRSDLRDKTYRKAIYAQVTIGKLDFTLVGVHLKSGRGKQEQAVRDRQAKVIGNFVRKFRAENEREDLLLVGDFNMIPGQDVSNFHFLGGKDLMDFLSSWDLQDRYSHILPSGRANLLDGFAISRTYSTEYIPGSLRLFPVHWALGMGREKFRKQVSDHLPFVAAFRIDRSRD